MVNMVQKWNMKMEIVLALLKGSAHVRRLSKLTSIPHATLSRALNEMVKENMLDFKQDGRNKVFVLKKGIEALAVARSAEDYKLMKFLLEYPGMAVLSEEILKRCRSRLILLFGSYAKFTAKKGSDIDVFIETGKKSIKSEVEKIDSRINAKIGRFDPKNILVKEIIKDHVILRGVDEFYEKNKVFA